MKPAAKRLGTLDRYLTLWIFAAMAVGIALGHFVPGLPAALQRASSGTTHVPLAVGLIAMLVPPFAKVEYALLPGVLRNTRLLGLSLFLNWVVGPLLMFGLAALFLSDHPDCFSGLVLIGLARCIAMVLVWNDLAEGNREYGAALVALNSLFQVFAYPFYAWFFMTQLPAWLGLESVAMDLPVAMVAESVLLYLGLPFVLGAAIRWWGRRTWGAEAFERRILPRLGRVTPVALLFTIGVMFSLKGEALLALPGDVLRMAVPLVIYFATMFAIGFFLAKSLGTSYDRSAAVAFTAAGNNFELAIAVAVGVFGLGSGQALAGVIGPLIEVPTLLLLVQVARRWSW
jgi:ACR3 family arsenite transporter